MSEPGTVTVLIPHAGDAQRLERCLSSLTDAAVADVRVVMPRDAAASRELTSRHPNVRAIVCDRLLPFGEATNLAADGATTTYLLLLNDDAWATPGAIDRLAGVLDERPGVAVAGAHLLNPDGSEQYSAYADPSWTALAELILQPLLLRLPRRLSRFPYRRDPRRLPEQIWVSGAALMVRRDLYERVGGLDERFPHGIEDAALCLHARRAGLRVEVVAGAHVLHEGGTSGWRHASDPSKVARALLRGTEGWRVYWRHYRDAGALGQTLLAATFAVLAASRVAAFSVIGLRSRPGSPAHLRLRAHRLYLRGLLGRPC